MSIAAPLCVLIRAMLICDPRTHLIRVADAPPFFRRRVHLPREGAAYRSATARGRVARAAPR